MSPSVDLLINVVAGAMLISSVSLFFLAPKAIQGLNGRTALVFALFSVLAFGAGVFFCYTQVVTPLLRALNG
ncbi:hypothetical protein ABZ631_23195 [Nocardiopsis alba]|uniref:hypothetical protein n=1 Tax=Nocardiopsis alba TaxID=53437 RepID=UPI0033DF399D